MNVLHPHFTDAQAWPLQIPSMPKLAAEGAYAPGASYSAGNLAEVQEYGALRGVQVVVEIDAPGHTACVALSHPELMRAFNLQPAWASYSAEPSSAQLKLNDSVLEEFLAKL